MRKLLQLTATAMAALSLTGCFKKPGKDVPVEVDLYITVASAEVAKTTLEPLVTPFVSEGCEAVVFPRLRVHSATTSKAVALYSKTPAELRLLAKSSMNMLRKLAVKPSLAELANAAKADLETIDLAPVVAKNGQKLPLALGAAIVAGAHTADGASMVLVVQQSGADAVTLAGGLGMDVTAANSGLLGLTTPSELKAAYRKSVASIACPAKSDMANKDGQSSATTQAPLARALLVFYDVLGSASSFASTSAPDADANASAKVQTTAETGVVLDRSDKSKTIPTPPAPPAIAAQAEPVKRLAAATTSQGRGVVDIPTAEVNTGTADSAKVLLKPQALSAASSTRSQDVEPSTFVSCAAAIDAVKTSLGQPNWYGKRKPWVLFGGLYTRRDCTSDQDRQIAYLCPRVAALAESGLEGIKDSDEHYYCPSAKVGVN